MHERRRSTPQTMEERPRRRMVRSSSKVTTTHTTASETFPKLVPSVFALAVALAAAQLAVRHGSCTGVHPGWCRHRHPCCRRRCSGHARSCKSIPLTAALVSGRLLAQRPTGFSSSSCRGTAECGSSSSALGTAACSKPLAGPRAAAARQAASSRPAPSSSSPSSRKGATESDRTSAAPAPLLLPVHAC